MNKIFIELEEDTTIATVKLNQNNLCKTKFVNIDDLIEILKSSKVTFNTSRRKDENKDIINDTELLPVHNGTSVTRVIEYGNGNKLIVLKKNKCRHDFAYHDTIFSNVGIPTLLFFIYLNKNNIIYNAKVFSIKDDIVTEKTVLYKYPFTNTYINGDICFGANKDKLAIDNYNNLAYFADKFLMMPATHDLKFECVLNVSYREFIEVLQDMDFNDDFLVKTNTKYENVINNKW